MGPTEEISRFVTLVTVDDTSAEAARPAKHSMLDGLGLAVAGSTSEAGPPTDASSNLDRACLRRGLQRPQGPGDRGPAPHDGQGFAKHGEVLERGAQQRPKSAHALTSSVPPSVRPMIRCSHSVTVRTIWSHPGPLTSGGFADETGRRDTDVRPTRYRRRCGLRGGGRRGSCPSARPNGSSPTRRAGSSRPWTAGAPTHDGRRTASVSPRYRTDAVPQASTGH